MSGAAASALYPKAVFEKLMVKGTKNAQKTPDNFFVTVGERP
jgi:hypothetical protein